jgi:signal transduction histidine kinase
MLLGAEAGSQRSWALATATFGLGVVLYTYDDWTQNLPPWCQIGLNDLEILIMAPGMAVLVFTLSELVRLRDARLRERLEQEREQRFRFLGRIAASMAHEVRNPLHNIRLLAAELRHQKQGLAPDLIDSIGENIARLDHATMLIYELAKPPRRHGAVAVGSVPLGPLLDAVVDEVRRRHDGPSDVQITTIPPSLEVGGRREGLRIILQNLIRNAVEAAHGRRVSIRCQVSGTTVEVRIVNPGRLLHAGQDEPVDDDDTRHGGLGVGVSIAHHLTALSGGSLTFEEQHGEVTALLRLQEAT